MKKKTIKEWQELSESTLPMKKFNVTVTRTSYSSRDIEVEAKNEKEAKEKAVDVAGDFEFSERDADYDVENIFEL